MSNAADLDRNAGNVLFISHNAADRPFAVALHAAIRDSDTLIDVRYSTNDKAGPQGGEKWREWIYRQAVEARTALIVEDKAFVTTPDEAALYGKYLRRVVKDQERARDVYSTALQAKADSY